MVAKALDQELNAHTSVGPTAEVRDLTGLVKKKKKNPDTDTPSNSTVKRKAEEECDDAQSEKKAKLEQAS